MTDGSSDRASEPGRGRLWSVTSQAFNAASNLLLAVMVARESSPEAFGAWAVAYIAYAASVQVSRVAVHRPYMLAALDDPGRGDSDTAGVLSTAAGFGILAGLISLICALVTNGALASTFTVIGLCLPLLLVQDSLRFVGFRGGQTRASALADASWLTAQVVAFAALTVSDTATPATLTLAWALAAVLVLATPLRRQLSLSAHAGREYVSAHRTKLPPLLGEVGLVALSVHAIPIVLATTGGLAAAGALRAGQTLMGAVSMVVAGLTPLIAVDTTRRLGRAERPRRILASWSGTIAVVAVVNGALLLLLPDAAGTLLLGSSWAAASTILLPLIVQSLLRGPLVISPLLLQAHGRYGMALRLRLLTSVPAMILPIIGAVLSGATGAAWGIAIGAVINTGQCLRATPHR